MLSRQINHESLMCRHAMSAAVLFLVMLLTACSDGAGDAGKMAALTAATTNPPASVMTGLDFPGSAAVATTMRFKFDRPDLNGLPIYGPSNAGVTYIWRAYPRQQSGYYTAFFWGNDNGGDNNTGFRWHDGLADTFYGAHPYPDVAPNGSTHKWEIALESNDFVNGPVVYDRWYTQALRVWADASGQKHHEFYWDLPATDAAHMVSRTSGSQWNNVNPPVPALTWGDAPWNPGAEVWNGILTGIQIYAANLSVADIQSEVANPLSTSAGAANVWYLNVNPTPSDISDKSGKGHHPAWVGSERPRLYTQNVSAPVARDDSYAARTGAALTVGSPGVLGNDTGVSGGQVNALLVSAPSHGSLSLNTNGSFNYTPNSDFTGADSFSYQASDGGVQSNTATVTLTVSSSNQPPVATNDTYATAVSTPLILAAPGVLENDSDPDSGTTLSAALLTTTSHGTLSLNANGGLSYTPANGFTGTDTFTYQAGDGMLQSNTATVTLSVTSGNRAPVATNDAYATAAGVPLTIAAPGVLGNDSDPDSEAALSAVLLTTTTHGTLSLNANGGLSYMPANGFTGTDTFTYQAGDGTLQSNTATVTLTIGNANAPFTVTPATMTYDGTARGANQTAAISITNNTTENMRVTWNDSISWLVATSGDSITIPSGSSGIISHTASMAGLSAGTYSGTATVQSGRVTQRITVTLTVSGGTGSSASAGLTRPVRRR